MLSAFTLKAKLSRKCDCHRLLRVRVRTVTLINRGGRTEGTPGINGTRGEKPLREEIYLANVKKRFDNTTGCSCEDTPEEAAVSC